ncbi:MAG: hypothetical protein RIC56_08245 [Pseudomonadales bacterium]
MSDRYKLLFRGEVLDGQHPAVVRKRLAAGAGFADEALDKLFSGKPVVVKRDADTATAARLQAVFKQAGARLRVLPVEADGTPATGASGAAPAAAAADAADRSSAPAQPRAPSDDATAAGLELLPPGSDVLQESERVVFEPREVDTGDLKLEGARFAQPAAPAEPQGPDVSHLSVAQVGVDLGPGRDSSAAPVSVPDLEVAAAGTDLASMRAPVAPAIDLSQVSFDVAPAGSELGQRKSLAPPPPPDTSHLALKSPETD